SRRRHTIFDCDWSSDVCSSDLSLADVLVLTVCGSFATYAGDANFNTSTSANEPHTVNLPLIINMTVAKSHSGNFTQGQLGAQYRSEERRVGKGWRVRWVMDGVK